MKKNVFNGVCMLTEESMKRRMEEFEHHAVDLRGHYWRIRYARFERERRRYYRKAEKEKALLAGLGYDAELIRLYGLCLISPFCERRRQKYQEFFQVPLQLSLF